MKQNKGDEKWIKYAALIQCQIIAMFDDDSDNHINKKEFNDGENLKQFFHALSSVVPASLFNTFTGDDKNFLEFNHVANQLCFEFMTP